MNNKPSTVASVAFSFPPIYSYEEVNQRGYTSLLLSQIIGQQNSVAMVDKGEIAFRPVVEVSYLKKTDQRDLLSAMKCDGCTPALVQASKLKALAYENQLDSSVMIEHAGAKLYLLLTRSKPLKVAACLAFTERVFVLFDT